jgi:hypothetical protein
LLQGTKALNGASKEEEVGTLAINNSGKIAFDRTCCETILHVAKWEKISTSPILEKHLQQV